MRRRLVFCVCDPVGSNFLFLSFLDFERICSDREKGREVGLAMQDEPIRARPPGKIVSTGPGKDLPCVTSHSETRFGS